MTPTADRVLLRWLLCAGLLVGAAAVALAALPAQPYACTLVGAEPGVVLKPESGGALPADWAVEVRRPSEPWVAAGPPGSEAAYAQLPLPDADEVELEVRVSDPEGVIAESTVLVRTVPFSPNGRACGPTVGRAVLLLSVDGAVR